jgi:hypothetical protein
MSGLAALPAAAQQFVQTENNQAINEYLAAAPENQNIPIMYVFYNGSDCYNCTEAIDLIYDVYDRNYAADFNIFTIDYTADNAFDFAAAYDLSQPMSVVLVAIKNGEAIGYYKIDNPQYWVDDPSYFVDSLSSQINNFLAI